MFDNKANLTSESHRDPSHWGHRGYGNNAQVVCSMATTAITSMPGFINSYTSMPGQSRALVCPERGVTPGIRPYARCHNTIGNTTRATSHERGTIATRYAAAVQLWGYSATQRSAWPPLTPPSATCEPTDWAGQVLRWSAHLTSVVS